MFKGIKGLVESKKGTLSLLVLGCLTGLAAFGKVDGVAFAAGCTLISTVYCFTAAKVDCASMNKG